MILLRFIIVLLIVISACEVEATVFYDTGVENKTCNTTVADAEFVDGHMWDSNNPLPAANPPAYVRCSLTPPQGTKYLEWQTIATTIDGNGRCTPPDNDLFCTHDAGVAIYLDATALSLGQTIYQGAFVRYDRISSRDIWLDSGQADSWDKCIEWHAGSTRWGIGCGWPASVYNAVNGKYTFDIWCADSVFGDCQTVGNFDHKAQNTNGYSASSPFLADYGKWYAVVMAVTLQTGGTGKAELYINGTKITDFTGVTTGASPVMDHMGLLGTIGQVAYDTPDHYIRMDRLLLTDSLTDITNAGLMSDPEAGGSPPSGSSLILFLQESAGIVIALGQWAIMMGYLWDKRIQMIRALLTVIYYMNLRQLYWTIKYKHAVSKWQSQAPVMIDHKNVDTLDLHKHDKIWQHYD